MPTLDTNILFGVLIGLLVLDLLLVAYFRPWRWRGLARAQAPALQADGVAARLDLDSGRGGPLVTLQDGSGDAAPEPVDAASAEPDGHDHDQRRDGFIDPGTGLETVAAWEEAIRHEEARTARYGRTATIVVVELEGLDDLARQLGADVADRLIVPVAETLRRNSRSSDCVARVGHSRFHVLMPETDEVAAINYVDRIRESADMWLEAGAVAVRVALGWASPSVGGLLSDALRVADERMQADRRARPRSRPIRPSKARSGASSA
jgi:diguanylate cyclase (GGDEF)-like protein